MIFADLPSNSSVFVDANTFVYHFQPHPALGPPCTMLLKRIELKEMAGFTSTHVLSEIAHRLMTMEASIIASNDSDFDRVTGITRFEPM